MCGDARCQRPPEQDPAWRSYRFGPGVAPGRVEHTEGLGWAVFTFTVPQERAALDEPTLLLADPADAEVAWLNGTPVGGAGVVGLRYLTVPAGPRVLALPRELLRAGDNELALKVLFAEKKAGVFSGPLLLGERERVELESERMRRPHIASEAAFLSFFLLATAFFAVLILRGVVRRDYLLFSVFLLLFTVSFVCDSHLLQLAGLSSPWTEQLQAVSRRALALVMLSLVTTVAGHRFGRVYALFFAFGAALLLLEVVLPPLHALQWLALPRKGLLGLLALWYLFLLARATHERRADAVPAFLGVAAYVAGARLDLYWGIPAREYGTGAFALAMLYTITSRHARLNSRIEEISARLLDAHEEERRRIARDIHDGVGQSLLALRLKLQMLAGKVDPSCAVAPGTVPALASEAGDIVEELRRTVLDLRPVAAETDDLATAMRSHAATVAAQHGLELGFHQGREPLPELPPRQRAHLLRIFQEMLANVQRHAAARRVDVSLHREERLVVLQVSDDGRGFDPAGPGGGVGLETMRERAELLGGSFAVESAPERGTVVTVEVPLP